jgi:DNA-binding NarL/FixJ family response regulator
MSGFSSREQAVFQSLARGRTTDEVAREMHLSPHTVRTYVRTGLRKLDSRTRAHGVAVAINRGLISSAAADLDLTEQRP